MKNFKTLKFCIRNRSVREAKLIRKISWLHADTPPPPMILTTPPPFWIKTAACKPACRDSNEVEKLMNRDIYNGHYWRIIPWHRKNWKCNFHEIFSWLYHKNVCFITIHVIWSSILPKIDVIGPQSEASKNMCITAGNHRISNHCYRLPKMISFKILVCCTLIGA